MDIDRPPDIVVIAGGAPVARARVAAVTGATHVIAVDAGVRAAMELGLSVDLAVGDFDSLDQHLVDRLEELAADVRRHPADKDATDLELALDEAVALGSQRVLVAGIEGGRPDHALANLQLLASAPLAGLDIEVVLEHGRGWIVRDRLHGSLPAGSLVSVVPLLGPATVSVAGVRWPLDRELLAAGTTRGVSNEVLGGAIHLSVHAGTTICIAPHLDSEVQP